MRRWDFSLIQQRVDRVLWALALVLLPVTSFRYIPFFSEAQVKPLSIFPAILLILSILLRCYRERRILFWNPAAILLLSFVLLASISTAFGAFLPSPEGSLFTYENRVLRAWITLLVGLTFFFLPITLVRTEDDLIFSLKWIFIGLSGHFFWSLAQWVEITITSRVFEGMMLGNFVDSLQKTFSMAGIAVNRRISGLALEPSWLAAQIAVLYLPWLIAGILTGYSFSRFRWISIILLGPILLLSLLTYSRSGILIIIMAAFLTLVVSGRGLVKLVWRWFSQPFHRSSCGRIKIIKISFRLLTLLFFVLAIIGGVFLLSQNKYFSALWQVHGESLTDYLVGIYAGPRLAFAWAGWEIFTSHPWFGVGLGASGFYIRDSLPDWSHFNISEISLILTPVYKGFPNVKILYIRILAEVGIVGFWIWMAFNFYIFSRVLSLLRSPSKYLVFTGIAGCFIWFSTMLLNLTLDSFAMPLLWLPLGMILGLEQGFQ